MTTAPIKIVRPWPADQPRPPVTYRTDGLKASTTEASNTQRPPRARSAA